MSGFIQRQCLSDYLSSWTPLLVLNVHVVALFLILMIVALVSRHIHEKHFRYTRRVNMFHILSLFQHCSTSFLLVASWKPWHCCAFAHCY
jgi:hypothetical protein